eukprot:1297676-Ditylum_brightwellii.AAC.1
MDVGKMSSSRSDASHDNKVVRFSLGHMREGWVGLIPQYVHQQGMYRPHPDKPQNFAQIVVMQKPNFKKALKALAKKHVVMDGYKKDEGMNSLLDLLS